MMTLSIFDPRGVIVRHVTGAEMELLLLNIREDEEFIVGDYDPATYYIADGEAVLYPPRPGPWAAWSGAEWIDPRTPEDIEDEREQALVLLRAERDRRLAASDWTQMPDAPLAEAAREAWRLYRQALRDLPETTTDPAAPEWPAPPNED